MILKLKGRIRQSKFLKQKEIELTITIPKSIIHQVDEYIDLVGIEHGIVRGGEVKYTQDAKREFFVLECIKQILERDVNELEEIKVFFEEYVKVVEHESESSSLVSNILGDELADF